MNDKGKVSVFLCVLLSSMLILAVTVIRVVDIRNAKARTAMCGRTALSSIKATYNNYIFDKYHILLFDKNCSGKGEGYVEERIKDNLQYNLGSEFSINDVMLDKTKGIMDNRYEELKSQIADYMKITVTKQEIGKLLDDLQKHSSSQDKIPKPEEMPQMDQENTSPGFLDDADEIYEEEIGNEGEISTACVSYKDPRDFVKNIMSGSLLYFVVPKDMPVCSDSVDLSEAPSHSVYAFSNDVIDLDVSFDNEDALYGMLSKNEAAFDTKKIANEAINIGMEIEYARQVFNCATNYKINEESVFNFEMEYLIAGGSSDENNLEYVVKRIILCRMPVNFAYLCRSSVKMNEIRLISIPLSVAAFVPEPVIRYLLAGCWSYIESVMDARLLLHGKRIAFTKNESNWLTDIDFFETIDCSNVPDSKTGLKYEDYLVVFMLANYKTFYARMLDIMELNAQTVDEKFQIESSVTKLKVNMDVDYRGYDCSTSVSTGY